MIVVGVTAGFRPRFAAFGRAAQGGPSAPCVRPTGGGQQDHVRLGNATSESSVEEEEPTPKAAARDVGYCQRGARHGPVCGPGGSQRYQFLSPKRWFSNIVDFVHGTTVGADPTFGRCGGRIGRALRPALDGVTHSAQLPCRVLFLFLLLLRATYVRTYVYSLTWCTYPGCESESSDSY